MFTAPRRGARCFILAPLRPSPSHARSMGHLYPEKTPCGCLAMYFPTTSSRPNVALTAPNCATYNAPSMSTDSSEADAACHTSVVCMDNRAAPACAPLLPTPVGMNGDGTVEWKRWTSMGQTRSPEPRGPLTTLTQPSATPPTLTAPRDRAEQTLPLPPSGGRQAAVAPRNLLWRCVKWPLRKLLLGAYLAGATCVGASGSTPPMCGQPTTRPGAAI
jgi:hypothetical protein